MKKRSISDLGKNASPVTAEIREADKTLPTTAISEARREVQLLLDQPFQKMRDDFERLKASPQWRAMAKLEAALHALRADPDINVSEPCTDLLDMVTELLSRAWPHHPIEDIVQPMQKHFDSVKGKQAVDVRYQNDPKQAAKADVKLCWETWQNNPDEYESKEDFARYMRDRFPILKSVRKITNWCRDWKGERNKS